MFKNILLSIDDSQYTEKNVEFVSNLVKELDSKLTILYVAALPPVPTPVTYLDPKPFLDAGKQLLNKFKSKAQKIGVSATTKIDITYGNPANKIIEYAEKEGFDMIAIGAKGRSKIRNLLLGSVADRVVRNAPCPVLVIR